MYRIDYLQVIERRTMGFLETNNLGDSSEFYAEVTVGNSSLWAALGTFHP